MRRVTEREPTEEMADALRKWVDLYVSQCALVRELSALRS